LTSETRRCYIPRPDGIIREERERKGKRSKAAQKEELRQSKRIKREDGERTTGAKRKEV